MENLSLKNDGADLGLLWNEHQTWKSNANNFIN